MWCGLIENANQCVFGDLGVSVTLAFPQAPAGHSSAFSRETIKWDLVLKVGAGPPT